MDLASVLADLRKSEERIHVLESIMDNLPSMIGYWDHQLINKYCNQAYYSYFGKTRPQIEGRHMREVLGEELFKRNSVFIEGALRGEKQTFERGIPLPDGTIKHTQAHYIPDIRNGEIHGFYVLVFDIGPLKLAAMEKEKIYQQVSETHKMVALGEMAGGVAHEINTPLGIVSMNVGIAEEIIDRPEIDREKLKERLALIRKTTARISRIVTALLQFSKDRRGEPFKNVPVRSILEDTIPFCQEKFKNHEIRLLMPRPIPDAEVHCRPIEISQVLVNFLNNAYDAVQSHNDKWIAIDVRVLEKFVEIGVTDSGPGVPIEIQKKIMQPFFTTKDVGKGTGLGLSLSKGIAESHGGSIYLDASSKATRFAIRLPKQQIV